MKELEAMSDAEVAEANGEAMGGVDEVLGGVEMAS